jgi:hypothetical protein
MTKHLFTGNRAGGSIAHFDTASAEECIAQCVAPECDEPLTISICVDVLQQGPAPLGTDSFLQLALSWGSPRAGVKQIPIDCGMGARLSIEGATTITANLRYVLGPLARGPRYSASATLTLGRAGVILPNTCTLLPFSLGAGVESAPTPIPRFAKVLRVLTDRGNTFPASQQAIVRFYRSALDARAAALAVAIENNAAIPIPAGYEAFSIENRLVVALVAQPAFDLLLA